jgi:hypothetical protein
MKLFNNTPNDAHWSVSSASGGLNCGEIAANDTLDLPQWDNQQNVRVAFFALGKAAPPSETAPFSVTIPQSKAGMAVTIGLYQE